LSRAEQLRAQIAQTIHELRAGDTGIELAGTIAKLASVEIKTVFAEIKYRKLVSSEAPINFFTPLLA
jgi:capsule polysaccharide export protein KpsE/RkpR